jgi:hypothetical protein
LSFTNSPSNLPSSLLLSCSCMLHSCNLTSRPKRLDQQKREGAPPGTWQRNINEFQIILNLPVKIISHRTRRLIPDSKTSNLALWPLAPFSNNCLCSLRLHRIIIDVCGLCGDYMKSRYIYEVIDMTAFIC